MLQVQYDIADHPLRSAKVADLQTSDPDAFEANNILAELLLGLQDIAVLDDPDDLDRATYATVLQVNFQVAQGLDPLLLSQKTSLLRVSKTYRDVLINPQALAVVAALVGTGEPYGNPWGEWLTSLRGPTS